MCNSEIAHKYWLYTLSRSVAPTLRSTSAWMSGLRASSSGTSRETVLDFSDPRPPEKL